MLKSRSAKLLRKLARVWRFDKKIGFGKPVLPEECKIQATFLPSRAGSTFDRWNRGELAGQLSQFSRCSIGKLTQPGRSVRISVTVCSNCLMMISWLQFAISINLAYAGAVSLVDKNSTAYPRRLRAKNVKMTSKLDPARRPITGACSRLGSYESVRLFQYPICVLLQLAGGPSAYSSEQPHLYIDQGHRQCVVQSPPLRERDNRSAAFGRHQSQ